MNDQSDSMREYLRRHIELENQLAAAEISDIEFLHAIADARLSAMPGLSPDELLAMKDTMDAEMIAIYEEEKRRGLARLPN